MSGMLELEEAQARLLALVKPMPGETLPVGEALGRYLAEPLVAQRDSPAADVSAMDAYAASGDGPWTVIGESRAGHPFGSPVGEGEAVAISTGAVVPQGANRIIVVEEAERDGEMLRSTGTDTAGRFIRRRAGNFEESARLLEAGSPVNAAIVGLALSAGVAEVAVAGAPTVKLLDCGDELVREADGAAAHHVPASNAAMLAALLAPTGAVATTAPPVPDSLDALVAAIEGARDADTIVLTGGASVGAHDLVRPALETSGARLDFWRVAIKPGKPLLVATRGDQVILGLPGNPVSAYITAFLFLLPLVRAMMGARDPLPKAIALPLDGELGEGGTRREFLRARLTDRGVAPVRAQESHALHGLALSDALIDRPAGAALADPGTLVPVFSIGNGAFA